MTEPLPRDVTVVGSITLTLARIRKHKLIVVLGR